MHERVKCEVCGQEICNGWVMEFLNWGVPKLALFYQKKREKNGFQGNGCIL